MHTGSNIICIPLVRFKQKIVTRFCVMQSVERVRKFKGSHNGVDLEK